MNDKGKFPFDGTPKVGDDFQESHNKTQEMIEQEKQATQDAKVKEEEKTYDEPEPTPKPSWDNRLNYFANNELHMPYIIDEKHRSQEITNDQQNYDVIRDNNIETEFDLKNEWDSKVWEAPSPEIGDD